MSDGRLVFDTGINTEGIQTGLSSIKKILTAGIAGLVAKKALDIGKMGIDFNAQMEQYQASFKVLLGNGKAAAKHIAELKKMAAKTPFEMGDLASASKTLLAFGDDADKVQGHLKMLGDISLGNKESFSSLSLAFGQVKAQGRLMGQDLMQMTNVGFNPLKVISEETGESISSLRDKMAKGQITFEDVAHAMEVATSKGGQFYGGLEEQSKTFTGQMSTLKDNVHELLKELTKPIFEKLKSDILPAIMSGVDWMMGHLPLVEAAIGAIGTALTVGFAINKFSAIKGAIKAVGLAIKTFIVGNPFLLMAAAIAAVVAGLVIFVKSGGDINKLGDNIAKFAENLAQKVPIIAEKFSALVPKFIQVIVKALPSLINAGVTILKSLVQGVITALPALITAGISLILALVNGLISAIPTLMAALPNVISALLNGFITALPLLITAGIKLIVALAGGLIQAIPQLVSFLPQIITAIIVGIRMLGGALISLGAELLGKLWAGISSWVGNLYSNVRSMAAAIPGRIKSGLGSLYSVGVHWLTGLWNGIANKVEWVKSKVAGVGHAILNKIKGVFKTHSPSRATMAIGEMVGKGLGLGIESETGGLVKTAINQAKQILGVYEGIDIPEFTTNFKPAGIMPRLFKPYELASQEAAPIINQTININEPVKTPWETGRALRKEAIKFGLAGAYNG